MANEPCETPKSEVTELFDKSEVLKKLPKEEKSEIKRFLFRAISSYSGPIPPPEMLEKYIKINPELGNKIFSMAEEESKHRRSVDNRLIDISARGQVLGFFVILCLVAAGAWTVYEHAYWVASGIFTTTIVTLALAFFVPSRKN